MSGNYFIWSWKMYIFIMKTTSAYELLFKNWKGTADTNNWKNLKRIFYIAEVLYRLKVMKTSILQMWICFPKATVTSISLNLLQHSLVGQLLFFTNLSSSLLREWSWSVAIKTSVTLCNQNHRIIWHCVVMNNTF